MPLDLLRHSGSLTLSDHRHDCHQHSPQFQRAFIMRFSLGKIALIKKYHCLHFLVALLILVLSPSSALAGNNKYKSLSFADFAAQLVGSNNTSVQSFFQYRLNKWRSKFKKRLLARYYKKFYQKPEPEPVADTSDPQEVLALAQSLNIPLTQTLDDGRVIELLRFENGRPIYYVTDNASAADTVSSDDVKLGGFTGFGLTGGGQNIAMWDAGSVLTTHQELFPNVIIEDSSAVSEHATHVAGTLIAKGIAGPEFLGMAEGARLLSYDWTDDVTEMRARQQSLEPVLVSNHSYSQLTGWHFDGVDWFWYGDRQLSADEDQTFGYYDTSSREWDQLAAEFPNYLMVKSVGNDRGDIGTTGEHFDWTPTGFVLSNENHPPDGGASGYDAVAGGAGSAKNVLTIGAVEDIVGGYSGPADVVVDASSGFGPTDDGRIKPDLVANGVDINSTFATQGTDIDGFFYGSASGASAATPVVSGSVALLQEQLQNQFGQALRSATMKALLVNTADEAGAALGPDYQHGWGLLNTRSAAQLIADDGGLNAIHFFELSLGDTANLSFQVFTDGIVPMTVTLAWTDPAGVVPAATIDPSDLLLVNDLDVRVLDPFGVEYFPWVLDPADPAAAATRGDNFRDPIEQVRIPAGVGGFYTIQIRNKGAVQNAVQDYSVVVSGNAPVDLQPAIIASVPNIQTIVGQAYRYDTDGIVDILGSAPAFFSLTTAPLGMLISPDGQITWTPAPDQIGTHTVEISVDNLIGVSTQQFVVTVMPQEVVLNFDVQTPISFGGTQDGVGNVAIEDAGLTLRMRGNRWQAIDLSYEVTVNTVLNFDFSSGGQGEVHAIGFDDDLVISSANGFQLYGSQLWGIQDFANYPGGGAVQNYSIPVGQFYTGPFRYLFFAMDDDAAASGESVFSNVVIQELN